MPDSLFPIKENILPQPRVLPQGAPVPAPYTEIAVGDSIGGGGNDFLPPPERKSDLAKTVTSGELYNARRYSMYEPFKTENDYAWGQSGLDQAVNGILKGLNLAATTIVGGFGVLGGAVASPFTGKLSTIWDNSLLRALDEYNNNVDNYILPNYYTDLEKNAPWYSTDNWLTTNFLFDKLVKNSGFAVGAMLSGNLVDIALLRSGAEIGRAAMAGARAAEASKAFEVFTPLLRNTARAFSNGKNLEVAAILEKELSTIADVSAKSSKIADLAKATTNQFAQFGNTGRRTAIAAYSSAGEASFEALQTGKELRENLIEEYKTNNNGEEPAGDELARIDEYVQKVGKASFFGNLGILSVTEFSQLPRLLGSSYAAERRAANSLLGETKDVVLKKGKYEAVVPTTKFGKVYSKARDIGAYVFDPKEAAQEVLQYALQVGTQNYFNKAYQSKDVNAITDGFLYGFTGVNEAGEGIGALNSKEGMESLILGGVTGGLMQIKGNLAERKALKSNTDRFIEGLNNAPTFRDAFKERLDSANRGIILQQQQQDAVLQGDKLEAKDLDADMMHNYLVPRIKYGRLNMVLDDIAELRQSGATEQGLTELKEEGLANINDTVQSYQKRLTEFENIAKNTAEIYRAFDLRFSGEVLKDDKGNPILDSDGRQQRKYSPLVIDKMVYAASKVADYDVRIPQVNESLTKMGINTQDVIDSIIKDGKPNKEATAKALNDINNLDVLDTVKDQLKSDLSDVIELSLRRKMFIKEHNDIKEKPLNYEVLPGYGYDVDEKDKTPVDVVQKEIDAEDRRKETTKKLEIGKEYSLKEALTKEGSKLQLAPKITVLSQTLGGELEVKLPNGKTTFLSPEQFKSYNISDENNTSQENADILDKAIDTVLKEEKYSEVKKEMPKLEEGQKLDKVGWVNSLDNQDLINDIEKEFDTQTKEIFAERERLKKEAEQLKRNKEEITKQQNEIEQSSGDVGTNSPNVDKDVPEGKIPNANILFISGTSESEDPKELVDDNGNVIDPVQSAIHIRNSREFLNNVGGFKNRKNMRAILVTPLTEKAYGLEGLTQMSYGVKSEDLKTKEQKEEFLKKTTNKETGLIAQVFVEQVGDKLFFVNKNGEQIGEFGKQLDKEVLQNVIFQTMRTTNLNYRDGSPRYRKDQKEEAEAYKEAWTKQRADIFATEPSAPPTIYGFQVSRGIAEKGDVDNYVAGTLISKDNEAKLLATDQTLIQIPTAGVVAHHTGQINMPNGRPVLVHQDNVEFLNNVQFKGKRAQAIYEAINQIATEINEQSKAGKRVIINKKLSRFLQNVLYWRKGSTTEGSNQINISEDGSSISFGGKTYSIPEIASKKDEIMEAIEKSYHNVNNDSLSAEMFSKPFLEYYIDETGKLSEEPREWTNYQTYLLSSTYPDGSARPVTDTPLSTKIKVPTPEIPYTHKQKYATLIGLELPVGVIAKPEKKAEPTPKAPTERKYDYDGETDNIFTSPFGDIIFTVKEGEEAVIDEEDDTVKSTKSNIIKKLNDVRIKSGEEALPEEELSDRAMEFVRGYIKKEVDADLALPEAAPTEEAPKAEEKKEEVPTATVSDEKSDIEKTLYGTISGSIPLSQALPNGVYTDLGNGLFAYADKNEKIAAIVDRNNNYLVSKSFWNASTNKWQLPNQANLKDDAKRLGIDEATYIKKYQDAIDSLNKTELAALEGKPAVSDVERLQSIKGTLRVDLGGFSIDNLSKEAYDNLIHATADPFYKNLEEWISEYRKTQKPFAVVDSSEIIKEYTSALEKAKPVEAPKAPGSFDVKNVKKRGNMFRKAGALSEVDRMTEADYKAFKEWHAKNVPNIPFEVLENIINVVGGEKAWGVFENGVAKFVRGGLRGTEYHEIGEAIWNGMLSPDEQQALINEFRKKPGQFTDRETNKKYNHDDPTVSDNMVKERILDDFADYRLGKLPARSLGEAVRKFFKMIMDFFKSFVTKPSLKEDLFKAIDTGKFKDRELSAESKSMPPQYRSAGHLTEEQTNAYVKDMTAIASAIILGNGNIGTIDKSALYDLRKLTSDDIFNKIKELYTEYDVIKEIGEIAWNDLVVKTKRELKTLLKIDFNEEDLVNINESETNKNDYAREPFSIDYKKSAPIGIKFVSATIPETVPTNQENSTSFELPKLKVNPKTETYSLLGYTRVFNTMLDKLKNTTGIGKVVDKIVSLANQDSNYVRMFKALGGSYSSDEQGRMTKTINFKDFKFEDWRLFIEMMQTYTKQKPDAVVQYISQGQVYSGSALVTGIVNSTTKGWIQNMRDLANKADSYVTYNSGTGTYSITDLSKIPTNTPEEKIEFLSKLGVIFPIEAWKKLKEPQQKEFTLAVASIKTYLQGVKDIMNIKKKTLDVAGQYDTLATLLVGVTHPNQETTRINLDGKQSNSFADNNTPSVFENEFNEVGTLDELLKLRPELNDVFSTNGKKGDEFKTNSQILKKGGLFFDKNGNRTSLQLKVGYIEGTKNKDDNKGVTSAKLTVGDRFAQEINQNLLGQYYIMIPADGSTEWMMNMGNHVSFEDIEQGKDGWKQINKIFRGYLIDDVALALDADNRKQLRNVGGKAKELRFFKDILSEKTLSKINEMIAEGSTQKDIEKYIDENIDDVNASIKEYIDSTVAETKTILTTNGQITFVSRDKATDVDYYSYPKLIDTFAQKESLNKNKLTQDDITNILTFANANYIINNIEYHKILFGDPYQFAVKADGSLDATKRFKSFLSPRRTTFDSPEINTFLNDEMNKAQEIELKPGEPGYHNHKAWMNTVTVNDVNVVGSVANMKNVPKEVRDAFAKTNEGDASSIMMDGTYRELKIKNGQWNIKGKEEAWHQWQMAWTRQNLPKEVFQYSNDARGRALAKQDEALIKTKQPSHVIEVVKPIVSGVKNGSNNINLILDKFSQMPMYYSMVKGTNLEKLYIKMMKENKGYIIMISGRKVGAEALHDLYTPKGEFNDAAFNNNVEVSWKSYGIQVETTYEGDKQQTRGSQLTKLSTLDLYNNGEPIGDKPGRKEVIDSEVKRNKDILDRLHKNGYERLLKRLGIEDLNGSYAIRDKRALAKTLQTEMFRRELSDNVIDSLQQDESGEFIIPFEASPAYLQIKSILYSLVDKEITSPKVNGGSYVQAPVTLWENSKAGRKIAIKTEDGYRQITRQEYDSYPPEEQKKVVLTDDTLKFYEDVDGKRYCEIMLPHWFKGKLGKHAGKSDEELMDFFKTKEGKELGKELLSGIGFRIPTQSLSSVEMFRVKGFLPQYMGKTVIVPSEITTKAGSDFDIDKLNIYLKSTYIDKNGDIKIVKLKDSEEATKEFYGQVFEEKLAKKRVSKLELLDAIDAVINDEELDEDAADKYGDYIDKLFSDLNTVEQRMDVRNEVQEQFDKLTSDEVQNALKQEFVDNMYRRALENEYYDSLEKLVTFPENFQRLISPVSDDGLKELSKDLDKLRGYDETSIKNRLLNRNYMTSLRHAFVTAKRWVGIAAVNITGHSLTQKFKAYIDPARFNNIPIEDAKILRYGNGEVLLDHNKLEENGQSYISLSGRLDADGEFISDGLSGYATAFVDVAKDPYILKIIKNDLAVGTFMFLRRIGVPKRQLVMFMNQPIIDEYLTMLDNKGVKNLFDSRMIVAIEQKFPTSVTASSFLGFNKSELEKNIENYYATKVDDNGVIYTKDLGSEKNHEQNNILREFLKYAKMAEYSFNLTQASNYDTTKFQSGDSLSLKQWRTEAAKNKNIISSVDNLLNSNFIGVQAEYLDKGMDALGEALPLDKPEFTDITDEVLKSYANDKFLGKDKFDKIANKIKAAFLDYIIQKRSNVATNLQQQLVDDKKSVAQMLLKAKQTYPNVQIIQDLEVDSSGRIGGAQTIKLKVNDKIAYNENMYTGMMRELRDDPNTNALYKGIVRLAILQGTYQSSISIKNIIPVEDYAAEITPIISGLRADEELMAFAKSNEFQRNEWQDNDVVPVLEPRFQEVEPDFTAPLDEPRRFQAALVKVKTKGIELTYKGAFPNLPGLVKSKERQLLFLNAKYNAKVVNYDVIKVPRAVPIDKKKLEEGKIDVATGMEITNQTYAEKIKKGDTSLQNYYGYQKVKYADGSPLIAEYDRDGNPVYVYKFINLHGDGMYATEYYGDGRPSIFNNGSQKNVKNIEGTIVSNEIPDQDIIDYYGGENVPSSEADVITATIEKETSAAPTEVVSAPEVEVEKSVQDIINESNLEPNEYEVVEINGKQRVINKRFVPERVKKGFSKFYSTYPDVGVFIERYGKKIIIPGFEDINLMMEQDTNNVYELSTGLGVPTISTTQKATKEEVVKLFNEKNIRKALGDSKKIDVNNNLLTKIAPEGLPSIDNNNQNNCG